MYNAPGGGTDWTTITGQTTGNAITPAPTTDVTFNAMTVKAGSIDISVADTPVAQNVVAGAQGFTFANYQFDATASGEDVKFSSLILELVASGGSEYLTGCQLWDGSTALNTASNKKDVASGLTTTSDMTFTLDSAGVIVPKGTVKTIALKCNLSASATTQTYKWDMTNGTTQTGTGVDSGTSVTDTATTGTGQTMTASSYGTLTVAKDATSPAYAIAAAGTTDVVLGKLKFSATNEAITLKKLGLELTGTASSSPSDLTKVTLWDGTTKVGETIFTSTEYATSTITGSFVIPKDGNKVMTIKGDLATIGTSQVGTQGALIKVNYVGVSGFKSSTQGVGDQSGTTIDSTTATDTAVAGVRVFRSYPTFAKIAVGSTGLTSGTKDLYKFSITANNTDGASEGIGIYKFTLNLATSSDNATTGSTTVTNLKVYAYTDSAMENPVANSVDATAFSNGQIVTTVATPLAGTTGTDNELLIIGGAETLQIPAGSTYYFKVVGTVGIESGTGTDANNWVKAYIDGDAAYRVNSATLLDIATVIDGDTNDNFVWSPYATTTSALLHQDWTNGYKVLGLPADGMTDSQINQ